MKLITPRITYFQVVRAKYEVEKKKTQPISIYLDFDWEIFVNEYSFATKLLKDWQGESLSEQTDELKKYIKKELV